MTPALSIVDYVYELKNAGFSDQQAEVQAKKLEQVIFAAKAEFKKEMKEEFQEKGLANKSDVRESELRLQKDIIEIQREIIEIKKDITEIKKEIIEIKKDITEIKKEIKDLELRINENINKAKLSVIMWVGIFFISNGLLVHFLK